MSGPYKCPDCGIWWAGVEHRCALVIPGGSPPVGTVPEPERLVIRPYVGPMGMGSTSSPPWCGICGGWHIPGAGPCTATYS